MMDEKTEELRDIFLSVSDEETVTESQTADRGSLTGDAETDEAGLNEVLDQLREKFGFEVSLSDSKRCQLIESFYDGADDEELAATLDTDTETVFRARMEQHLIREDEPALPEETVETIRDSPERSPEELATRIDATATEISRARAVIEAMERSRRVSQRFRTAFEERLTGINLTDQFAADAHEDGLDGATEGMETEVDF